MAEIPVTRIKRKLPWWLGLLALLALLLLLLLFSRSCNDRGAAVDNNSNRNANVSGTTNGNAVVNGSSTANNANGATGRQQR